MKANIGTIDRSLRIAVGLLLIALRCDRLVGLDRLSATGYCHFPFLPCLNAAGHQNV